jgi:acetyl esterase/lipase
MVLALVPALLLAGCESALFAFANRGLAAPDATVAYDPARGLSLDVYRPAARDTPAPTVLFLYGGAWRRGERWQYQFVGRRLADAGMLAIVADYRTFPDARFPGFVEDAARAAAWASANAGDFGGNGQLFLAGHSAGAHIAALLGTDARHLEAVGLAPGRLAGVIGLAGPYDFAIDGGLRDVFGPQAQWSRTQPVDFVDGDEPPFLLIHGTRDRRVEVVDSRILGSRLVDAGVDARVALLPDGGHDAPLLGLYSPDRWPRVMSEITRFVGLRPTRDQRPAKR